MLLQSTVFISGDISRVVIKHYLCYKISYSITTPLLNLLIVIAYEEIQSTIIHDFCVVRYVSELLMNDIWSISIFLQC